jgi:hypothetical protein
MRTARNCEVTTCRLSIATNSLLSRGSPSCVVQCSLAVVRCALNLFRCALIRTYSETSTHSAQRQQPTDIEHLFCRSNMSLP